MKEFEWFEWFEWFGPSPIEPFNSGRDGHREVAAAHGLRLDGLAGGGDLGVLRRGELLEAYVFSN